MREAYLDYHRLLGQALHAMVRRILDQVAEKGLIGQHHFVITFDTRTPGVEMADSLRGKYPESMTIILQHQFAHLAVTEESFSVDLTFGGLPHSLRVPYAALQEFRDPHAGFSIVFTTDAPMPRPAWKLAAPPKPKGGGRPPPLALVSSAGDAGARIPPGRNPSKSTGSSAPRGRGKSPQTPKGTLVSLTDFQRKSDQRRNDP